MADEEVMSGEMEEGGRPKRKNVVLAGILLGVMLVEGLAVFILVKHFTPEPQQANAQLVEGLDGQGGIQEPGDVEVQVSTLRAPNEKLGLVIYELVVAAVVSEDKAEECQKLLSEKKWKIQDRLSGIIRESDPKELQNNLGAIRQKFKNELSDILGDQEMIKEVLIPSVVPFSAN